MRKKFSLALALVTALTISSGTQAQNRRRQQPKRVQPTTNATPKKDSKPISSAERLRQALIKLLDVAAKAESELRSNPSGGNVEELHTQLSTIHQSAVIQFNTDASTLKAIENMIDAYSDAHRLYGLATYKAPTVEEFIRKEQMKEEEERAGTVQLIKELRTRALYEDDPIKRDELRAKAGLYEAVMRFRHSEVSGTAGQRAATEARRKEIDEVGKQAAQIVDKYGLRDRWVEDPSKAVNEIVNVGGMYRDALQQYLVEPSSFATRLAQLQQTFAQREASSKSAIRSDDLAGTWTLYISINSINYQIPLTVKLENGRHSGVIGISESPITVSDIPFSGNNFTLNIPNVLIQGQRFTLTISGSVEGNSIIGKYSMKDASGGTYTVLLSGVRVAQ